MAVRAAAVALQWAWQAGSHEPALLEQKYICGGDVAGKCDDDIRAVAGTRKNGDGCLYVFPQSVVVE